jgi:hypothetical protein
MNVTGQKVAEYNFGQLPAGNQLQKVSLNLGSGTYLLKLFRDNKETITRKMVITKQ